MSTAARSAARHFRQLDGLRTFAVAAVIGSHLLPKTTVLGVDLLGDGAYLGVRLFFVLSGFLITGLLLDAREQLQAGTTSFRRAMTHFYVRRALRILPLYFLVVVVAWVLDLEPARRAIGWFLTFTYNLHLIRQDAWDPNLSHVWSLSVEQQFYLLWPWLVLTAPAQALMPLAAGMLALGNAAKYYYAAHAASGLAFYVSPLASADALGAGALVAMAARTPRGSTTATRLFRPPFVTTTLLLTVTASWWFPLLEPRAGYAAELFYQAVHLHAFAGLMQRASQGIGGPLGAWLASTSTVYLGTISYGLYVYHPLMPLVASRLGVAAPDAGGPVAVHALASVVLSVAVAALSWHLFEKPLNDLKRYFR